MEQPAGDDGDGMVQDGKVPVVLSEGASIALGSVLSRFVAPVTDGKRTNVNGKRPRPVTKGPKHIVLADNEEVQASLTQQREQRQKLKQQKRAKLQFESNSRVIPDVALGAALERELIATATKGSVALFNAVAKAQKIAEEVSAKEKKKGPPVSRENFMDMMKAGVSKSVALPTGKRPTDEGDESSGDKEKASDKPSDSVKWLKDDFMTIGANKLKEWDREEEDDDEDSEEEQDKESDGKEDSASEEGDSESEDDDGSA